MLIFLLILLSVTIGLVGLFVPKKIWMLEVLSAIAAVIQLGAGITIALRVADGGTVAFGRYLSIDPLGAILILVISIIGPLATLYSIGYLRKEVEKGIIGFRRVREYHVLLQFYIASMYLAVSSENPIMMWIAIEATTLVTAPFISFYNKPTAMEAAWKYLIINSVGLLFGLFGTLLFLTTTSGLDTIVNWEMIRSTAGNFDPFVLKMAFIFVVVGYGTKVGLAPMHTWLPDAHSKAPSPISALLSGVLLNVALFAILRFKGVVDIAIEPAFSSSILITLGTLSMVIAVFIILVQKNYKRLIAYSSVEHMGIIALGIGIGGVAAYAALLHLIYHSLTKSLLFLTTGNIFLKHSTTKIAGVRGIITSLPVTSILFVIGILSVTGIPPFGIFFTEVSILAAGISTFPVISLIALVALVLGFIGFLRHMASMLFGEVPADVKIGESNLWTVVPPLVLAAILITLSLSVPDQLKTLLDAAAANLS